MKLSMLIGCLALGAGIAGASAPARAESGVAGRWSGVLLRDGVQVPISMELLGSVGRLQVGETFAPIQDARATLAGVHFEVPDEGIFDGTVAGNSMAGSVSGGHATGSFSLEREQPSAFGDAISSSGP
jgi:hypothetical protein